MVKEYSFVVQDYFVQGKCTVANLSLSVSVLPAKTNFSVDNVRVIKILGSGLLQSEVIQGMMFKRQVEGDITKVEKAKIIVFTCPLDSMQTETKVSLWVRD